MNDDVKMAPKSQLPFLIDPKGGCFLCLKEIPNIITAATPLLFPDESHPSVLPFKLLTRHLKLDFRQVFGTGGTTLLLLGASELLVDPIIGYEVVVPLCEGCVELAGTFSGLYRRLDRLRLEVDAAVRNMHGVMLEADGDQERVFQYNQRVRAEELSSLGDGILRALSDKLRKEVLQKCSMLATRTPRVELRQLDTRHDIPKAGIDDDFQNVNVRKRKIVDDSTAIRSSAPPPPPPNLVTKEVHPSSEDKKISLAKYHMDQLCSKTIEEETRRTGSQPHKLAHSISNSHNDDDDDDADGSLAGRSFKCNLCSSGDGDDKARRFETFGSLWYHKCTTHRTTFFLKYKDPKKVTTLDHQSFEQIVATLFIQLDLRKGRNGSYSCKFCESFQSKGKILVENHTIRTHMDQLVPRLMELQRKKEELPQEEEEEEEDLGRGRDGIKKSAESPGHNNKPLLSLQCDLCAKPFRYPDHLRYHKYTQHRTSLFMKYRDPKLSSDHFKQALRTLFKGLVVQQRKMGSGKGDYRKKCGFCQSFQSKTPVVIENHCIRTHMDQLVPRLMDLQKNIIIPDVEQELRASSESSNQNLRKSLLQCNFCIKPSTPFRNSTDLRYHQFTKHRATFFLQYKEPSLPLEQFEAVVVKLFQGLELPKLQNGKYSCPFFCQTAPPPGNMKIGIEIHIIRKHMEELVPRLMGLQQQQVQLQQHVVAAVLQPTEDSGGDNVPKEIIKEKNLSFRKLAGRKKNITPAPAAVPKLYSNNKKPRKLTRTAIDRSAKCQYCSKLFRHQRVVRAHIKLKHRSTFFTQFKDPRLSSEQFERLVGLLFHQQVEAPPPQPGGGGGGGYKCLFCHPVERYCSNKVTTHAHWIHKHMDQLGSRFLKLQEENLLSFQPELLPPFVVENGRRPTGATGKEDRNISAATATTAYLSRGPSFSCNYCDELFGSARDANHHSVVSHTSRLLSGWRHSGIAPHVFDRVVNKIFADLMVHRGSEGCYSCAFCHLKTPKKEAEAYAHILTLHREQVVEILKNLQDRAVAAAVGQQLPVTQVPSHLLVSVATDFLLQPQPQQEDVVEPTGFQLSQSVESLNTVASNNSPIMTISTTSRSRHEAQNMLDDIGMEIDPAASVAISGSQIWENASSSNIISHDDDGHDSFVIKPEFCKVQIEEVSDERAAAAPEESEPVEDDEELRMILGI